MARIRSIKPELPQDAKLASVSRVARYHFVLLFTIADDAGYFRAAPRMLLGQLYPHDADVNEKELTRMNNELADIGVVEFRTTPDGPIGYLVNWNKHQRIDRPSSSHLRDSFASHSRVVSESLAAGVLSPESLVLSPDNADSDMETVLDHFLAVHPTRRRSATAVSAVKRGLGFGYSPAELCQAIDGNAKDPWHIEKCKHELDYVFRNGEKIDSFRQKAIAASRPLVDDNGVLTPEALAMLRYA